MSGAFLAALAGILGITLGRFWDRKSESSRWRRDQKTACYQRLTETFIEIYENIRTVAITEEETDEFIEAVHHARSTKTWDNALAAVWLHGSTPIVIAASSMDWALTKLFYDSQTHRFSIKEWDTARIASSDAFEGFVAAARKELDLPPAPIKLFPYVPN